jgi:hypothetical protein
MAAMSRKLSVSMGELRNVTAEARQAGERRSRKIAESGVREYRLACLESSPLTVR